MDKLDIYNRLLGREVVYLKDGKRKNGKMQSIGFDSDPYLHHHDRVYAVIVQKQGIMKKAASVFLPLDKTEKVPLEHVSIPRDMECSESPVASRTRSNTTQNHVPTSAYIARFEEKHFRYGQELYEKFNLDGLHLGQEVVWLLPESYQKILPNGVQLIGKVKFIGRHESVVGRLTYAAVVEFDQRTTQFPRFIQNDSGRFANLVYVDELLDLADWLATSDSQVDRLHQGTQSSPQTASSGSLSNRPLWSQAQQVQPSAPEPEKMEVDDLLGLNIGLSDCHISPNENTSQSSKLENADWRNTINFADFCRLVQTRKDRMFGIQGNNDSCYMDASLFSLFAFSHALDCLISKENDVNDLSKTMKAILRENVILPLRNDFFVPHKGSTDLRQVLGYFDTNYLKSYMDAEDFILKILETIDAPPMLDYENGVTDYVHQIMLPETWNVSQKLPFMTLQSLLDGSFEDLKLKQPPNGLFIIKLPVSNGELIPCQKVVPDFTLNLSNIIAGKTRGARGKSEETLLHLSAVICFRQSHYVSFVRAGREEHSPWICMDSSPSNGIPQVSILPNTGIILANFLRHVNFRTRMAECPTAMSEEEKFYVKRLFQDAYICIYENSHDQY